MKTELSTARMAQLYNCSKKIRLEQDSTLPDYCSDIERVISTRAQAFLDSKKVYLRDNTLYCEISGRVCFYVVYLTDTLNTESHTLSCEFSDTVRTDMGNIDPESVSVLVSPSIDNAMCKVQSPRRVNVRADLLLDVRAFANTVFDCYCNGDEKNTQIRKIDIPVSINVAPCDADFKISSEFRLPKSCPPMERILSAGVQLSLENASVSNGVVNFFGNAGVTCMYVPEADSQGNAKPESFYQPIELKGSIECDMAGDDMAATVTATLTDLQYEIISDEFGENRILKTDLSYAVQSNLFENSTLCLTQDIYGVGCCVQPTFDNRIIEQYVGTLRESTAIKEKIPLKRCAQRLEGVVANACVKDTFTENGELFANCRVRISGIGVSDDGDFSFDEDIDTCIHLNLPSEIKNKLDCASYDISQTAGYVDADTDSANASVSFDVVSVADFYIGEEVGFVASAELSECDCKVSGNTFCYPSSEDTLWTVGKRYGVSIDSLCSANSMTDSDPLRRVMAIPEK